MRVLQRNLKVSYRRYIEKSTHTDFLFLEHDSDDGSTATGSEEEEEGPNQASAPDNEENESLSHQFFYEGGGEDDYTNAPGFDNELDDGGDLNEGGRRDDMENGSGGINRLELSLDIDKHMLYNEIWGRRRESGSLK